MDYNTKVAEILLETESVKVQPDNLFTWTSGIQSPIYCDNRRLIGFVEERNAIVAGLRALCEGFGEFDYLAGTSTAGIPWAAFLAELMQKPMVYVRGKPKGHGAGKQVEGYIENGMKVVVVEDLISTGGSSVTTVEALRREADADVIGIAAIFTYGFSKSAERFKDTGIDCSTLASFSDLLELLLSQEKLTESQHASLQKFTADPQGWLD